MSAWYLLFCAFCVLTLKEVNTLVGEPYMDEPFHVPQAQAYCRGEFMTWDPKITTPPGLYLWSLLLKRVFLLKCTLPMLRLTSLLSLLALPVVLTRLLCFHQRERHPTSLLNARADAIVLSAFPIAWFFGFLYYTDIPSLVTVLLTIVAATEDKHWLAALFGIISCSFRQTNVIWVLYAFASSQLMELRFRRALPGQPPPKKLHDPPALAASSVDLLHAIRSAPAILPDILPLFIPYASVLALFGAFVVWNGGIVLGDKANHVPAFHIPQLYYFLAFSTILGWPALIGGSGGLQGLIRDVGYRMRSVFTVVISIVMAVTINLFTIHHPFLLSDNRHYTFYVWRRVFMFHHVVPYLFIPGYVACGWAWFLRVGQEQTLLQTLVLPICTLPILIPTPLLEPRYFVIPYILLRSQIVGMTPRRLAVEGIWYGVINVMTMGVFLYLPRADGSIRFMW
ncbi:glucosyltransferase [Pluteus cervinus]|uniref:Glucosyltransferase n=1 Tax=Pluteus cervinus TaxID=181527 RepID=A0ACD3BFF8_9AGAR|nr:glucosyltransferase [Pluteus cervinus]